MKFDLRNYEKWSASFSKLQKEERIPYLNYLHVLHTKLLLLGSKS